MYTVRFRFKKAIINCTQITLYGGDSSTCTINYASIEPHTPICLLFSFPCDLESRLTHTTHTLIVCVSVLQLILDFLDSHNIVMVRRVLDTNVSPEFVHVHNYMHVVYVDRTEDTLGAIHFNTHMQC